MTLLQKYFWKQALWPLLITLGALTTLAILTQSLSTLDLIVENRQSALTFFYITLLALPQLIGIILPLAVFIAALYALNRLNMDSEMTVAKSVGSSPWEIANPLLRLACWAMIFHFIINLVLQPLSFREMRQEILSIRTDIAAQMVRAGEFVTPAPGLTFYARNVRPNGEMADVIIRDKRSGEQASTYIAKTGFISRQNQSAVLTLKDGIIQQNEDDGAIRPIFFESYQLDLSQIMALDSTLRLKPSDRFLHELLFPKSELHFGNNYENVLIAEGHARLSTPLYNVALILLAISFMVRGPLQRMGYGRRIAICAFVGFVIRLSGFALASASERDTAMNIAQYALPLFVILACLWFILNRNRAGRFRNLFRRQKRRKSNAKDLPTYANA